ncbi:phage baseplate upper protein [Bacillus safensis]|uniref:phage baseplate upper protein n=1 Tax=Bacillus safensis TaxID=561879 RepID=UPI0030003A58
MVSKNGRLDFDVNAYTNSSVSTSINFWTQDRQTARLTFKLTKDGVPLPLSAVTGKLVLVMSDGSRFIRDVTIVDRVSGHAEYVLSDKEVKHYGNVQAELNLYYTNDQSMSVHQFSFKISKSLIDQDIVPITEYYVDEFEALREKINFLYEESIQTIEELRAKFNDLEKIETKKGAQTKADAALAAAKKYTDDHSNNSEIHVTQSEKKKWNGGQLYKITQDSGERKPLPTELNGTDVLSLPPGRYYSAGKYLTNMPTTNDGSYYNIDVEASETRKDIRVCRSFDNLHWFGTVHTGGVFKGWKRVLTEEDKVTENEKDKWNNSQLSKITADNGIPLIYVRDVSESILDKIINNGLGMGTFYAVTNSKDLPSASRSIRGTYHITDASNGKGTFGWVYATDFANVTYHNYLNNGSWRGWQRVLTDDELSSTWNLVTLINGTAQHNSVYPLKFSIRQNTLHLRGSFENIPPSETVIARFAQKPSSNATFGGTTVGSYGSARLSLTEDGSLKFDGLSANDPSKVNRIEINELIPLW